MKFAGRDEFVNRLALHFPAWNSKQFLKRGLLISIVPSAFSATIPIGDASSRVVR